MLKRGFNADACSRLVRQLLAYVLGKRPFDSPCPLGTPVIDWWASMPDAQADLLKSLATLLYSVCPHAADPERLFSQLGFYEGQRRSGLGVDTLCMMATIKFHYDQQQPRYVCFQSVTGKCASAHQSIHCFIVLSAYVQGTC